MEFFFLCGFPLFFLFISLSLVPLFFNHKCSNASLPQPNYHLLSLLHVCTVANVGFQIQGAQAPAEGAFVETINGYNIPNAWKYYWIANSRHKIPGCIFSQGKENFEGKEYARLEMRVFMHEYSTKRITMYTKYQKHHPRVAYDWHWLPSSQG